MQQPDMLFDTVLDQDNDFEKQYNSERHFMQDHDPDYNAAVKFALKMRDEAFARSSCKQTTDDGNELYCNAAKVWKRWHAFVKQLAKEVGGVQLIKLGGLKKMPRVVEKGTYRPSKNRRKYSHVKDIVRGALVCKKMEKALLILKAVYNSSEITVDRVKDRFSIPANGGWSDFMINVHFNDDKTAHICELQVVLSRFWGIRADFNGHKDYNAFRRALEILKNVLGVKMTSMHMMAGPFGSKLVKMELELAELKRKGDQSSARARQVKSRFSATRERHHQLESLEVQMIDAVQDKHWGTVKVLADQLAKLTAPLPEGHAVAAAAVKAKPTNGPAGFTRIWHMESWDDITPSRDRSTGTYDLSVLEIKALAARSSKVLIRDASNHNVCVQNKDGVVWPLQRLEEGMSMSKTLEGEDISAEIAQRTWEGPQVASMTNSQTPDHALSDMLYHACCNGNGLHLGANSCCEWSWQHAAPVEVWLGGKR